MEPLSINEALAQIEQLAGKDVLIKGALSFEFENVALYHTPSNERRGAYESSIWLTVSNPNLGFDSKVCEKWHGKVVVVEGTLIKSDPAFGSGHMGLWPAEILARDMYRA